MLLNWRIASYAAPHAPAPKRLEGGLWYTLMVSLFYPAVLGTIFYSFLQIVFTPSLYIKDWHAFALFLLCLFVVIHYSIDYLFISLFQTYGILAFMVDTSVIMLLYNAFRSINPLEPTQDLRAFFYCFLLVYMIFVPHEIKIWLDYRAAQNKAQQTVHVRMLVHELFVLIGCSFFIIFPALATDIPSVILIGCVIVNYGFVLWHKYHVERMGWIVPDDHAAGASAGAVIVPAASVPVVVEAAPAPAVLPPMEPVPAERGPGAKSAEVDKAGGPR